MKNQRINWASGVYLRPFVAVDAVALLPNRCADGGCSCPKAAKGNGLTAVAATDDMAGEAADELDRTAGAQDGNHGMADCYFKSGSLPLQDLVVGAGKRCT